MSLFVIQGMIDSILQNLNPEQRRAVAFGNGPFLVIAGAGTGKTTVITKRLAWLIESKKAKIDEILALTFTDKAAQEMEERLDILLPYGCLDLWVSTFHSFCDRILRQHAFDIGLSSDYKLLDSTQTWILLKENLERFDFDYYRPLGNPFKFLQALISHFSRCKDEVILPEDYLQYAESLAQDQDQMMSGQSLTQIMEAAQAYHIYQQLLLENNALDFADLINYTLKLFKQRPHIRKFYQDKFKYILVDEFQDTNLAQYELIKLLVNSKQNLTVVGDDDQSVYKFRGASISNILNFKKDFPKSSEVVLTKNYRSGQKILDAAYSLIQNNNPDRLEYKLNEKNKKLVSQKLSLASQKKSKAQIQIFQAKDYIEEAVWILKKIKDLASASPDASWNDFAILVRANSQAELFCQALNGSNIPYIFYGSSGLYKEAVILDILAYLKILNDYYENFSLFRVLKIPVFKFSEEEIINLNYWAKRKAWPLYHALKNAGAIFNSPQNDLLEKIDRVLGLVEAHSAAARQKAALEIIEAFLKESGYLKFIKDKAEQESDKTFQRQALEDLKFLDQFYKKTAELLEEQDDKSIRKLGEIIDLQRQAGDLGKLDIDLEAGPEAVKIMTAHSAKGLEFKYVFIPNLVEQRFPTRSRGEGIEIPNKLVKEILPEGDFHLQEERRLFYVALTRVQDAVFLSWAENYGGRTKRKKSRFLEELNLKKTANAVFFKEDILGGTDTPSFFSIAKVSAEVAPASQIISGVENIKHHNYSRPKIIAKSSAKYSYSQIAAFRKCPLQYKYQFILQIPLRGKENYSFGQTMHSVMYEVFKRIKERSKTGGQSSLFGKSASQPSGISLDEILQIYDQKWIDEWYDSPQQKEKRKQAGCKILKDFYEKNKDNWQVPLELEKAFAFKLDDWVIKGRIDRIDQKKSDKSENIGIDHPSFAKATEGNGIEIIDYKTGSKKEKLIWTDREQLLLYQLVAEQGMNYKVQNLSYLYLSEKGVEKISFLGLDKDLEKFKNNFIETIKAIEKTEFKAAPSPFVCQYCDFKDICDESAV